ncbi:hypothetical protein [Streptomyces sp. NPDC005533]|uniref:hypothetical protein n=1 Tax=Streptomyces sp. NPDC005533 TaxID=3364723 RepID=UPI0036BA9621
MSQLWMPDAVRLDIGHPLPTGGGPAKAIAHITWDHNTTENDPVGLEPYDGVVAFFVRNNAAKAVAPHILWDPFTGRRTQFHPATSRSKDLGTQASGARANRAGAVVIQIEALFFPFCRVWGKVYGRLIDTPCKGWPELNAWVRAWGVPDTWPMGKPVDFTPRRSEIVWRTQAGWFAHAQVPESDRQCPGTWPAFTTA